MKIAMRYAEALFELARERGVLEQVTDSFERMMKILADHEDLFKMIAHPLVEKEEKKATLEQLTTGMEEEMTNFLMVVVDNKREGALPQIYEDFLDLVREAENRTLCEVRAPYSLDEAELAELKQNLAAMTQGDIELS